MPTTHPGNSPAPDLASGEVPGALVAVPRPPASPDDGGALTPVVLPGHTALVEDWLADLDRRVAVGQRAAQTRDVYRRTIRPWLRHLAAAARTDTPDPTTVERFLAAHRASGHAPATSNHALATICALYRFAERTGRYPHIARAAERLREHRDGPLPCLDHDQVLGLRAQAEAQVATAAAAVAQASGSDLDRCQRRHLVALRDRALLGVLYGTGVRLVSLHRTSVGDWLPHRGELRHQPKGHVAADAVAYVGDRTGRDLDAYLAARGTPAANDPLFASHARSNAGQRLSVRSLSQAVLTCLERGGHIHRNAAGHVSEPRRLSAHSLRRSVAKRVVETHDLELARQMLGHASPETTRRAYARVRRAEDLRQAARELEAG